jgi:hypothetical protein
VTIFSSSASDGMHRIALDAATIHSSHNPETARYKMFFFVLGNNVKLMEQYTCFQTALSTLW